MELTKQKSEAVAGMLQQLFADVDLFLGVTDFEAIDYLKAFEEQAENNRYAASVLGYDEIRDDKRKLELATLRAVINLLEVRKKQIDAMPELERKKQSQKAFDDLINNLI